MQLKLSRIGSVALLLAVAGLGSAALAEPPTIDECADCHEDVVQQIDRTAHATASGWVRETACSACHGDGREHIDSGGDIDLIVRPATLAPAEASAICLDCHQRQEKHFKAATALHRLADVSCIDCHDPHSAADEMLPHRGAELCGECHKTQVAQFDMPRSHPMGEGGEQCATCHDPHGSESLRMSSTLANATCGNCHFEKTAPFVYAHDVSLMDGCSACHTVHGSTNRHLLKYERQVNLCYECHSAAITPTFHSAPRFVTEKCTACHTAIHGSNTHPFFLEE